MLLLDGNAGLTGDLTWLCELEANFDRYFRADCVVDNPASANTTLFCPCCVCCDPKDLEECDGGSDELALYDPNWQTGFDRGTKYDFIDLNLTRY